MPKVKILNNSTCEINRKKFDVSFDLNDGKLPFHIDGNGKKDSSGYQYIKIEDFKGICSTDFIIGAEVNIFQATLPLKPFDNWSFRRKEHFGVLDLTAWYSHHDWEETYSLKVFLSKVKALIEKENNFVE